MPVRDSCAVGAGGVREDSAVGQAADRDAFPLCKLPPDLRAAVLQRLPPLPRVQASSVCKSWRATAAGLSFTELNITTTQLTHASFLLWLGVPGRAQQVTIFRVTGAEGGEQQDYLVLTHCRRLLRNIAIYQHPFNEQVERTLEQLPPSLEELSLTGIYAVRSTVLRFDAFPALRRLTLTGGLFKELRLPARLRQLTLGPGLMYNDISGTFESLESVDAPISFQPQLTTIAALPAVQQLSLDLSAGVGLDVTGLAALAPTLRRLVLMVRGLQLAGLGALAELHRLRHLQLRIQRGFYMLPGDQETELLETLRLPQNLRTLTVEPSSPGVCLPAALQRQIAVLPPATEPDCCSRQFE